MKEKIDKLIKRVSIPIHLDLQKIWFETLENEFKVVQVNNF